MKEIASANERKDTDTIALLVGKFDPPSIDHYRCIDAILSANLANRIWVCPLGNDDEHVRAMAALICTEATQPGRLVSLCSVALDKGLESPDELRIWCERKFKNRFILGFLDSELKRSTGIAVVVGNKVAIENGNAQIVLPKFLPVHEDIKSRIKNGRDERKSFIPSVWNYIQKNKLYR